MRPNVVFRVTVDNGDTSDAADYTQRADATEAYIKARRNPTTFSVRLSVETQGEPSKTLTYFERS